MVFPPSLPATELLKSYTYHHNPGISEKVILGVDEAGRGPVLGPMVYAVAYCATSFADELGAMGFADSKTLTAETRDALMHHIVEDSSASCNVGWATTIMTACDISEGMLRRDAGYNLNAQAHDTTIALIQLVLDSGVDVAEAYIDTVGPPEKYQAKLSQRFPAIKFTVTKKADSLFAIVSCASICAKVTRDASLDEQLSGCGSGYPSDPNTVSWLRENMDKTFGWGPMVRYSWATAREMLDKTGHLFDWPDDQLKFVPDAPAKGIPQTGLEWFGRVA